MLRFSDSTEIAKVTPLLDDFLKNVVYDEEPLFISDEATVWDIFSGAEEDLQQRLTSYYGRPFTRDELKQPLWTLLRQLYPEQS